ncbi:hypothetical protein ElyMa_002649300 [Elysia marginata]|uniref:Uncharacterized protein n=1 Tax=Elysia marginata TaxID=1093978 RepID=A0AAV4H8B3_9GAST|nr:hypothetical protein ElyMa_002649300 [Elysia marginata]
MEIDPFFSSATAANRYPLERNQGHDVQTNSSINRRGHLLSRKPCPLNDASRVQTNEVKRCEVWHNTPSQESRSFATNCISEAVKGATVLGSIDTLTLWQND